MFNKMKKEYNYLIIVVIVVSVLISLIYLFSDYRKPFKDIDLSFSTNTVNNYSDIAYADTLVHVALDEVGVDNVTVNIINMGHRASYLQDPDFELRAFVDYFPEMNTYTIFIYERISRSQLLTSIAHESIHIKQYYTGDLIVLEFPYVEFKGELYNLLEVSYWNRPWEIEAYDKTLDIEFNIRDRVL